MRKNAVRTLLLAVTIAGTAAFGIAGEIEEAVNCCGKSDGKDLCRYVDSATKGCGQSQPCPATDYKTCCTNACGGS
jgi:hypothetical protein